MTPKEPITTGADKLLDLVDSKGEVTAASAAKILRISKDIINEWSDMLESKELIISEYTLWDRYLVSKDPKNTNPHQLKKFKKELQEAMSKDKGSSPEIVLRKRELEIDDKLDTLNKKIKELKHYDHKRTTVEEKISLLEKREANLKKFEESLNEKNQILVKEQASLAKQMIEVSAKETTLMRVRKELKRREAVLIRREDELKGLLNKLKKVSEDLKKRKDVRDQKYEQFRKSEESIWTLVGKLIPNGRRMRSK
jgi:DNA repair exonuclease SbcCD ATPase subunit